MFEFCRIDLQRGRFLLLHSLGRHRELTSVGPRLAVGYGASDDATQDAGRRTQDAGATLTMKYNHIGIPTIVNFDGEIPLPHLKVTVSDHQNNPFGIQWQRYWDGAPYPDLVKTVPHVAFEVDDLTAAIRDRKVIIEPNSPSKGVMVAFIEVNGAPVELMQIDHSLRKDL
jgi:hypothetical protein